MSTRQRSLGVQAEDWACSYLALRGVQILHRNVRYPEGEIDIIGMHQGVLCFVEVRARESVEHGHPLETVTLAKQRRIVRAASLFLEQYQGTFHQTRFDVVGIVWQQDLETTWIQHAFEA